MVRNTYNDGFFLTPLAYCKFLNQLSICRFVPNKMVNTFYRMAITVMIKDKFAVFIIVVTLFFIFVFFFKFIRQGLEKNLGFVITITFFFNVEKLTTYQISLN